MPTQIKTTQGLAFHCILYNVAIFYGLIFADFSLRNSRMLKLNWVFNCIWSDFANKDTYGSLKVTLPVRHHMYKVFSTFQVWNEAKNILILFSFDFHNTVSLL